MISWYHAILPAVVASTLMTTSTPTHAQALPRPPVAVTNPRPVEVVFSLTTTGNPFDDTENDVHVVVAGPSGTQTLPAFYDGGMTWRVRLLPSMSGTYQVLRITRNGATVLARTTPQRWSVNRAQANFARKMVRVSPKNPTAFARLDGTTYYPIGQNVAWNTGTPIPTIFDHMGQAGENWARVWMNHWDGKNLDWPTPKEGRGYLDLGVARKWDDIVRAAERNGIAFQMTLQHHGQYSTRVNSNWGENPWNRALGGFLDKPEDFFTDTQARKLTRAKYRYIVARWGYSPSILAWELFNEVQFTDAANLKQYDAIASWHRDMASFLRAQDPWHHLITTSSDLNLPHLFDAVDYVQPHSYPPDVLAATQALHPAEWKKPLFYGEIGPGIPSKTAADEHAVVHRLLWGSLMSDASGAAQYWGWEGDKDPNVYPIYAAATAWVRQTGFASAQGMHAVTPFIATQSRGTAVWGPGADWGKGKQNVFPIRASGTVEGTADMPAFLQGKAHADLFTYAEFPVTLTAPATFTIKVEQSAKAGAHLVVRLDGATIAEQDFAPAATDQNAPSLTASVPAGTHALRLENTGADWVRLSGFTLSPFGPSLSVLSKASDNKAALWVYRRAGEAQAETATVTLADTLRAGTYRAQWFDTATGKLVQESTVTVKGNTPLVLVTPPVRQDIIAWIYKVR